MGALAVGGIIAGVGAIAGSVISASATKTAAGEEVNAAENQIQLQQNEFNQEQKNIAPYLAAGNTALQSLMSGFGANGQFTQQFTANNFAGTPQAAGLQFQEQQGSAAINANAAAKGQALSPATSEALASYNQGVANTTYQGWYNSAYQQWLNSQNTQIQGLETVAGMGQTAVGQENQAGQTATASETASEGAIGSAQAAGTLGTAAAVNSGIGGVSGALNNYVNQSYYASLFNPNGGVTNNAEPYTSPGPGLMTNPETGYTYNTPGYNATNATPVGP